MKSTVLSLFTAIYVLTGTSYAASGVEYSVALPLESQRVGISETQLEQCNLRLDLNLTSPNKLKLYPEEGLNVSGFGGNLFRLTKFHLSPLAFNEVASRLSQANRDRLQSRIDGSNFQPSFGQFLALTFGNNTVQLHVGQYYRASTPGAVQIDLAPISDLSGFSLQVNCGN